MFKWIALLTLILANLSCGFLEDENNDKPKDVKPEKHQVAMVSTGFDIDNAVFENKIKNAWDIRCQEMRHPFELLSGATRYEELKENFLNYLDLRKGCTIEKKINNEISSEFAKISGDFNEWNSAVLGGTVTQSRERQKVQAILKGENGKFNYTGTATAGLVASDNDKVDLHVISVNLRRVILFNDIINGVGCRSQSEIDLKAQLYKDEDVVKAFVDASREDADTLIASTLAPQGVTIVNETFGPSSIGEYEAYYKLLRCPEVKFRKFILAESEIRAARSKAIADRFGFRPLNVKAAGSAGQSLNLVSDTSAPCEDDDLNLLVGSLDREDKVAQFSNNGRCVDVYTLGAQVRTYAPKDFRDVDSGTVYSAPLIVRYLTENTEPGTSPEELKKFVFDAADEDKAIKMGDWNRDFAYEEKQPENNRPANNQIGRNNQPNNNNNNQPENNQGNNGYRNGWTQANVDAEINQCVQNVQTENGRPFCKCAVEGLAKKYTTAEIQQMQNNINQDPIVTDCQQKHPY